MIMRTLLAKEKVDDRLEFKELGTMTEGYSGSDLKVSVFDYIFGCLVVQCILRSGLELTVTSLLYRTCAQQLHIGQLGS